MSLWGFVNIITPEWVMVRLVSRCYMGLCVGCVCTCVRKAHNWHRTKVGRTREGRCVRAWSVHALTVRDGTRYLSTFSKERILNFLKKITSKLPWWIYNGNKQRRSTRAHKKGPQCCGAADVIINKILSNHPIESKMILMQKLRLFWAHRINTVASESIFYDQEPSSLILEGNKSRLN